MKKYLFVNLCLVVLLFILKAPVFAQNTQDNNIITVKGTVTDVSGAPLTGATVLISGTSRGVIVDLDGTYQIERVPSNGKLVFDFIGMQKLTIDVNGRKEIKVVMEVKANELDEVAVVAFSKQKKESVLASITTIKPAELKVPSSNLTTALSGRVAGLISYQTTGEPGNDNASFFVRGITTFGAEAKRDPLILIDGIELSASDLSRLNTDDIASFSIMKDATATALYGARGANGVILVTTKEGREGKAKVNVRIENSYSMPTQNIEIADPVTYMKLHNEAVRTRNPLGIQPYSLEKISMTEKGLYPNAYPATDWRDFMFKKLASSQRINFSVSGGGTIARYYIAGSYSRDNGNLKENERNGISSNVKLNKYSIRSNININLTKTTEAVVRLQTTFDDYNGPLYGGSDIYGKSMKANPVLFKPYYEPDKQYEYTRHILYGNYGTAKYLNPYAEMLRGFQNWTKNLMLAQFEVKQNLDELVKGLSVRGLYNLNRYSEFSVKRYYDPFYYNINNFDPANGSYTLYRLNPSEGSESLKYTEGPKYINTISYLEAAADYNRKFGEKHNVSGLLVFIMRGETTANAGTLQLSLPRRNMGVSGRFTYNYDSRYFVEANFGYNGSERFAQKERWGFFPSFGAAWFVSNENFFKKYKKVITQLKLKGTYGLVGNDAIGSADERFFYLSQVNLYSNNRRTVYGERLNQYLPGVEVSRYENDKITWEIAYKTNLGFEMTILDKLTVIADFFHEKRTNILVNRIMPSTSGVIPSLKANLGEASGKGFDVEANYQQAIGKDFWINARGTFTYATSKVLKWEEPDYSSMPWLSKVGRPINQYNGYIAERLFVDDREVYNSPRQFGEYLAGDIKYRDINGDGKISELDMVYMGHPVEPEINYGFGFSTGYKGLDLSIFFQGTARQSFWIDTYNSSPFINVQTDGTIGNNAFLKEFANSHWSESNPDSYALWPRLSNYVIENNQKRNSWFLQDASFLRLKSLEIGYTLPQSVLKKLKITNARLYVSGSNLLTFSRFKLWDPEMGSNGLAYPLQRVFNMGLNVSF